MSRSQNDHRDCIKTGGQNDTRFGTLHLQNLARNLTLFLEQSAVVEAKMTVKTEFKSSFQTKLIRFIVLVQNPARNLILFLGQSAGVGANMTVKTESKLSIKQRS